MGGGDSVLANDTTRPAGRHADDAVPGQRPELSGSLDAQRRRHVQLHARRQRELHRQLHLPGQRRRRTDAATAAVTITITPVNDNTPVADDDSITVAEGGTATGLDLDGGTQRAGQRHGHRPAERHADR